MDCDVQVKLFFFSFNVGLVFGACQDKEVAQLFWSHPEV